MNVRIVDYRDKNNSHHFTRSLRETGFAVLKNHCINVTLINKVYNEWRIFFESGLGKRYLFTQKNQDGYFPIGSENAKDSSVSDIKEFYHYYPWGRYPDELSDATKLLYKQLLELTSELLTWVQKETPEKIKSKFSTPLSQMIVGSKTNLLRIIHYPPLKGDEDPRAIRGAAHEDINLITLLVAGTKPGLQIKTLDGKWYDITCNPGCIAINTGDMLQELSDGYFPSTTHRVVNPKNNIENTSRYSMPLFLHPKDEIVLSSRYTARQYLDKRLKEIGLKK